MRTRFPRTPIIFERLLAAWMVWAVAAAGIGGAGCSPKSPAVNAEKKEAAPAEWDWKVYPPLPRMRVALLSCRLLPKSSLTIPSPVVGVLRVYIDEPQTELPAGFLWAEFEPAIFAAESNALARAELKLDERERLQYEIELPREKLKIQRQIEEAEYQLRLMQMMSTNEAMARHAFRLTGQAGTPLKPGALDKAELELELLSQNLEYLQETNTIALGVDLQGQRMEWDRRKLDFERRQAQARLRMPFDGQLTVSLPLTEGVEEYPVNLGQELAVARDLSVVRVRVPMSNPAWVTLRPERLQAIIRMPDGSELRAPFAFQKIERLQAREEAVFYFEFLPEASERAARLMGAEVSCELWHQPPAPVRIVPKMALLLWRPEAFQRRNWREGVRSLWPGAEIVLEGQTDLAIRLPEDEARISQSAP